MKLSISNIGINDEDLNKAYALMQSLGYTGLEIAPTKFIGLNPYNNLAKAGEMAKKLKDEYGFCISSMQSIWYGQQGNIFVPEQAYLLKEYTFKAINFAKAVKCKSMVFGCPKNRNIPQGGTQYDSYSFFENIAKYAFENGTAIALEANVPQYGTNFINTSLQAFELAKKIPYLKVNYDLGTLIAQNESLEVLTDNIDLVSHIHISEMGLAPIEKRQIHLELATLLKKKNYEGYVSIEMQTQPFNKLSSVLKYISEVFKC